MHMVGDPLAAAIAKQFPQKFSGAVDSPAANLRNTLNLALREHAILAAMATGSALGGRTAEFDAAVGAVDANSIDIAKAIGSVYGADAEKAFLPLWRKHIVFVVDYTTGLATKDKAKQDKAVADLIRYADDFGALFNVQTALISLIDVERQWFKSRQGIEGTETPRNLAFCSHAILEDDILVVPDARLDERFAGNPYVLGDPNVRFYAGAPLKGPNGYRVGTLCVLGPQDRSFTRADRALLRDLADWAEIELSNLELARALAALRREDQRKQEFVAMLAHELRTPLTAIRGALGLVSSGAVGSLPAKASALLQTATRNAERLSALVNDFLDLEKFASGDTALEVSPHDLNRLARQAAEDNAALANTCGMRIVTLLQDTPVYANVDANRLTQVLTNLLSNATKFSPAGSAIDLSVRVDDSKAIITVRDRGPGIPVEFVARLFQRFAQVNAIDNKSQRGTGLGLAICKTLIEGMRGDIRYRAAQGGGSEFVIEFERVSQ